jgi:crotonobetainyl-CoA:carnitine CoA-transferase CaiB-like acyl-CoA transferase
MQGIGSDTDRRMMRELLATINLDESLTGGRILIHGQDFPEISRHRLATANATALAGFGAAVAAIWRQRSGVGQDVSVSTARALQAIKCGQYVRQNGYRVPLGSRASWDDELSASAPLMQFLRTRDNRYIFVVAGHLLPHFLDRALDTLECPHNPQAIVNAVARWEGEELEEAMAECGVPAGLARTALEWREHLQGRYLNTRPVIEIEQIAASPPEPFEPAARPLAGVRVADLTHVLCGPTAARLLAEHGADVLHLSSPSRREDDAILLDTGWGKRSALLDLATPDGAASARQLLRDADVVIQSFRPGALARHGMGPSELTGIRPGVIYVSVSCYGDDGPWGRRGGYDPVAQAVSGIAFTEGGEVPRLAATETVNDYLAANLVVCRANNG